MKKFTEIRELIVKNRQELDDKFNVGKIGVFGSLVRGEAKKNSDIDILVEFKKPIGLFKFMDLEEFLGKLLKARIDLVSRKALKPYIGKHILKEVKFV